MARKQEAAGTVVGSFAARALEPGGRREARLRDGQRHRARSRGVHLGPGTLYGALSRLEAQGLIEAVAAERPAPALPHHRRGSGAAAASGCDVRGRGRDGPDAAASGGSADMSARRGAGRTARRRCSRSTPSRGGTLRRGDGGAARGRPAGRARAGLAAARRRCARMCARSDAGVRAWRRRRRCACPSARCSRAGCSSSWRAVCVRKGDRALRRGSSTHKPLLGGRGR